MFELWVWQAAQAPTPLEEK
jgi:hypothetical protein